MSKFWNDMRAVAARVAGAPAWMLAGINLSPQHYETFGGEMARKKRCRQRAGKSGQIRCEKREGHDGLHGAALANGYTEWSTPTDSPRGGEE